MGGQLELVFDWDRLENSLITRDWPVGDIVTNNIYKMPKLSTSITSAMQMQCTIALVSDAQTQQKAKCLLHLNHNWLPCNNRKTYYNTFAASAELAYGQPSQEAPWRIYVTNQLMDNFYVLSGILIEKFFFRQLVNSMQNQVQSTKWHSAINRLMWSTCWPPLVVYFSVANSSFKEYTKSSLIIYQIYICNRRIAIQCYFFNAFLLFHEDN